jgi:heme-degrading monooxygenase HmoA
MLTALPSPPYYAVVFSSLLSEQDEGYAETAQRMLMLAETQPGFLGVDCAREQRFGITVSYWRDLESIEAWKRQAEHREAQNMGKQRWYREFRVLVSRVERAYEFSAEKGAAAGEQPVATGRL